MILGVLSFDAFVTSSLSSDSNIGASFGCATPPFRLSSTRDSLPIKIFVDRESLDDNPRLVQGNATWSVSSCVLMWLLRQTKTNRAHSGDGTVLSRFFHTIGSHIVQDAKEAVIDRQTAEDFRGRCGEMLSPFSGTHSIWNKFVLPDTKGMNSLFVG